MKEAPGCFSRLSIWLLISAQVMHDLVVHEIETHMGLCTDRVVPAWDSLSLCLSPSLSVSSLLVLSLSVKINKHKKIKNTLSDKILRYFMINNGVSLKFKLYHAIQLLKILQSFLLHSE